MSYEKVPVDASTRFNNEIMNTIEPFNYNYLIDFNMFQIFYVEISIMRFP